MGGRSAAASDVEGCAADGLTASQLPPISGFRSATSRDGRWLSGLVASVAAVGAVSGLVALLEPHLPALSLERYEPDGSVTGVAAWGRVPVELAVGTRFDLDGLSIARGVQQTGGPVRVDRFGADDSGVIATEARALGIRSSVACPELTASPAPGPSWTRSLPTCASCPGASTRAILSEGGLGPALRTLARRSVVPVQLQVGWRGGCPSRSR